MPKFLATTSRGLSEVVQQELQELGFSHPHRLGGGVEFESNWEGCYKANLNLRTATRILLPVLDFPAYNGEDLYHNILKHDWTKYIDVDQTLAVEASVRESALKDQRFVAMKIKDAVVDQFREKFEKRPDVNSADPDLLIVVRVVKNHVQVSVDTSGASLFKRGYRIETVPAPMKEHLAAGLLKLANWDRQVPIVDPMCGSGTFLVEAALMALQIAPGTLRKEFGFQRLKSFKSEAWDKVVEESMENEKAELPFKIYGFDRDAQAIRAAKRNVQAAGVSEFIELRRNEVATLELPPELASQKGLVVVNPPYGERLNAEAEDAMRDLGFALKRNFKGWTAWVLQGNKDIASLMGLKSSRRIPVFNGPIECRWLQYEMR